MMLRAWNLYRLPLSGATGEIGGDPEASDGSVPGAPAAPGGKPVVRVGGVVGPDFSTLPNCWVWTNLP